MVCCLNLQVPSLKHIISARDFSVNDIQEIFHLASRMVGHYPKRMANKILATLFYEPSTRTRLSFETAMLRLGGNVVSSSAQDASTLKGESLEDTVKIVSSYVDFIAIRHPDDESAKIAAKDSSVPIINAGSGGLEHPTQALLDLYTIKSELGSVDGVTCCLVGDVKYSRTIHSLIYLLGLHKDNVIFTVSKNFRLPQEVLKFINNSGLKYHHYTSLEEAIKNKLDVIYLTRLQSDRHKCDWDDAYMFELEYLSKIGEKTLIMSPLPRCSELPKEIDQDPRAIYFKQAANGVLVRAALLCWIGEKSC